MTIVIKGLSLKPLIRGIKTVYKQIAVSSIKQDRTFMEFVAISIIGMFQIGVVSLGVWYVTFWELPTVQVTRLIIVLTLINWLYCTVMRKEEV